MGNGSYSRLHIKKILPDGVEINAFGDQPQEVIDLVCAAVSLAEGNVPEPPPSKAAHTARVSHEAQAAVNNPPPAAAKPVCPACGSNAQVELITFKGDNGKPLSRFKCQACNKWVGNKVG